MKNFFKNNWIILFVGSGLLASLIMAINNNYILERNKLDPATVRDCQRKNKRDIEQNNARIRLGGERFFVDKR